MDNIPYDKKGFYRQAAKRALRTQMHRTRTVSWPLCHSGAYPCPVWLWLTAIECQHCQGLYTLSEGRRSVSLHFRCIVCLLYPKDGDFAVDLPNEMTFSLLKYKDKG